MLGQVLALIILVILVLIPLTIWYLWDSVTSMFNIFGNVDCAKYGNSQIPLKKCNPGYSMWGGLCYENCPMGSTRTASCTCDFGSSTDVMTRCGYGIENLSMGQECAGANGVNVYGISDMGNGAKFKADGGRGWFKTAACSCQKGGLVSTYCKSQIPTSYCTTDRELYAGLCYKKCPTGMTRKSACVCE